MCGSVRGRETKKLKRKGFYELILSAQSMEMEEHLSFLEYALNNWKQDQSQTDDILVLGVEM
jgi:hypothetical protein